MKSAQSNSTHQIHSKSIDWFPGFYMRTKLAFNGLNITLLSHYLSAFLKQYLLKFGRELTALIKTEPFVFQVDTLQ